MPTTFVKRSFSPPTFLGGAGTRTPSGVVVPLGLTGSKPFSPLDLLPTLWLDAQNSPVYQTNDTSSPYTADGQTIGRWDDLSGNGNHATQATAGNRPVGKEAIQNGLRVVRFDGTNDFLVNAGFTVAQPDTIFVVAKGGSAISGRQVVDGQTARQTVYLTGASMPVSYFAGSAQSGSVNKDSLWFVASALFNGASSELRVDGASASTGNPGTNSLTALNIGTYDQASGFWSGDIAALLVYSAALATADRQNVERYLGARYGIAVT